LTSVLTVLVATKVRTTPEIVMVPKNSFYAQSGKVTVVINASACGPVQTAREHSREIGKVYAGRNGSGNAEETGSGVHPLWPS
jgi:hypothetical protein